MPLELKFAAGLALLGLLLPLVALYLLKTRHEVRVVSSIWLWAAVARAAEAKTPWQRLVPQLPLLLQAVALALFALAWARPATRGEGTTFDHLAVIVDTSASMSAQSGPGTRRIELARREAERWIDALSPRGEALLLEAGAEASLLAPLDRDRRRLRAALAKIEVEDSEGHLGRAVSMAADRLRALPGTNQIVIVTDGADPTVHGSDVPTRWIQVGTLVDNTALVRVDVRRGTDPATKRDQVQVFGLVAHFGVRERDVFVTLRQRNVDQPLDSRRLHLRPGERTPVVLTFEPAPADLGSGLVVQLSPPDAMPVDDVAFARVPPDSKLTVVLAPKDGSPWLARALLADPGVELMGTSLADLASVEIPDDALVVVEGACPPAGPGADWLVLNPPPGRCRTAQVGKAIEPARITSWTESDPRFRFVSLDGVTVGEARALTPEGPRQALVRAGEATLVADISLPEKTGTMIGFDVARSNWPLKASFVVFVRNLVELAREHRAHGITGPARAGEPLRVRVPQDVERVEVEDPKGEVYSVAARGGIAALPNLRRTGFYYVSWQGRKPGSALVPANLTSAVESDTGRKEEPRAVNPRRRQLVADGENAAFVEWGWLVAAVGLVVLLFDAWWLTRQRSNRLGAPSSGLSPMERRTVRSEAL